MKRFCLAVSLLFIALWAQAAVVVQDVRANRLTDKVQIVLDLDSSTMFQQFSLPDPPRIVLDIPHAQRSGRSGFTMNNGPVNSVRTGFKTQDTLRVVIDLNDVVKANIYTLPRKPGADTVSSWTCTTAAMIRRSHFPRWMTRKRLSSSLPAGRSQPVSSLMTWLPRRGKTPPPHRHHVRSRTRNRAASVSPHRPCSTRRRHNTRKFPSIRRQPVFRRRTSCKSVPPGIMQRLS